jgi:hypothetical protein
MEATRAVFVSLVLVFAIAETSAAKDYGLLKPFKTDACTSFPDGSSENPKAWRHCCIRHDLDYWAGGTADERLQSDRALKGCVEKAGHPGVAHTMYRAVRIWGGPQLKTPYRWGFGWDKLRGYSALTNDELREVRALAPEDLDQYL